jgi:hypothetical protein
MQKTRTPLHRPTNGCILSLLQKGKANGFLSSFISSQRLARSYPPPATTSILLLSPPPFVAVTGPHSHLRRGLGGKGSPQIRWLRSAAAKEATPTNAIGQVQFPWERVLGDESAAGWFKVRWFLFFLYPCWLLILVRSTDGMWNGSEKVCLLYGRSCFIVWTRF